MAMVTFREWERIQRIERAYQERKDPSTILAVNCLYWRRVLKSLPEGEFEIGPESRVLDAGCGGAGILLALEEGIRSGFDPLMGFYLERFPHLAEAPVRWIEADAEGFYAEEPFDFIFCINTLDHTRDPRRAAQNLEHLLAPSGKLVCVLNVHLTRFWRAYYERFYRFVDPPHPHHIHRDDVCGLFPSLKLRHVADIDALWLDFKETYDSEVCHRRRGSGRELLLSVLNPFKYPVALSEKVLHRPFHRRRINQRPIMATTLYLFTAR